MSRSRYRFITHNGAKLFQVGILPDGTLYNPNNYPEDEVRTAVLTADARKHLRKSNSAKKAAETRRERRDLEIKRVARRVLANNGIGSRRNCYICGRGLSDTASIERGIGSECWQGVLAELTRLSAEQAKQADIASTSALL
jgi:hypothetical protein